MKWKPEYAKFNIEEHPLNLTLNVVGAHGLTRLGSKSIVPSMFRKAIAGSVFTFWLLLLGIDFSADTGLIPDLGAEMDKAVHSVLAGLGEATKISDDTLLKIRPTLASHTGACFSSSLIHSVSTDCGNNEKPIPNENIPLYKFYLVFLI